MPLTCEIDAYGDFLQALGPSANPEVILVIVNHMYSVCTYIRITKVS